MVIPSESALAEDEGPLRDFDSRRAAPCDFEGSVFDLRAPHVRPSLGRTWGVDSRRAEPATELFYPFRSNEPKIYIDA